MDFMNRGNRPVQQNTQPHTPESAPNSYAPKSNKSKLKGKGKLNTLVYVVFLAAIAVLIVAVLLKVVSADNNSSKETTFVKSGQYQAVFLNDGQVYFGRIGELNSQYLKLSNIYYLRVNQQVQPDQENNKNNTPTTPTNVSLIKLGCELHGPEDTMLINREQIIFWENLKKDGQVAKNIEELIKAKQDGKTCEQPQTNNNNSSGNNTNTNANTNTNNNNTNNNSNSNNNN